MPPSVGHRGWLRVYIDVPQDWDELAELVTDAYRLVAPGGCSHCSPHPDQRRRGSPARALTRFHPR